MNTPIPIPLTSRRSSVPSRVAVPQYIEEPKNPDSKCPMFIAITTYLGYLIILIFGYAREFIGKLLFPSQYAHLREQNGYAPLNSGISSFYSRRVYFRIRDCWQRPITGVPGRTIKILERFSDDFNHTFKFVKGKTRELINLASYNYLGFAQNKGKCADDVISCIEKYGSGIGSSRAENGSLDLHVECERIVAEFVGKEDSMIFGMGFATNSTMIASLVSKGCLIVSDELNHASLVTGCRISKATVRVFKHNDIKSLESVLREAISQGQPRTHRPWKKILVIVEGLYSMEGHICPLPELVELRSRYKFYLFVDEAHSIGAMGPRGRGVCDFWNVDPSQVDVLMGTFTKSFGAAGGYIAGSKELIQSFKTTGIGYNYCEPITAPIIQQIITSLKIISGHDGTNEGQMKLEAIHSNSIYFMRRLKEMGFIVYGDEGSPIVPVLIYNAPKIAAFSREAIARGLAVVVVGFPATSVIESRVRFCISAAHTREDLDIALEKISEIGDILLMKYNKKSNPLFIF